MSDEADPKLEPAPAEPTTLQPTSQKTPEAAPLSPKPAASHTQQPTVRVPANKPPVDAPAKEVSRNRPVLFEVLQLQ